MTGWQDFFVAEVGASAALLGLVFVGVSINLHQIMATPNLPIRALQTVMTLLTVLVLCSLLLVPGVPSRAIGVETMVVGVVGLTAATWMTATESRRLEKRYRSRYAVIAGMGEAAMVFLVFAGAVVWSRGAGGLYWVVPGIILCLLDASANAWVLLIEINR